MPYKKCEKCGVESGVRAKSCADCGTEFFTQPKLNKIRKGKSEKCDWKTLKRGDTIKCVQGYGTYNGKFIVDEVKEDGFHAFHKDDRWHAYIYMGKKRKIKSGTLEPHKIRKISSSTLEPKTKTKVNKNVSRKSV